MPQTYGKQVTGHGGRAYAGLLAMCNSELCATDLMPLQTCNRMKSLAYVYCPATAYCPSVVYMRRGGCGGVCLHTCISAAKVCAAHAIV